MDLKNLSDQQLDQNCISAAKEEKKAMTIVLHHLCEVQRRRLFSRRECDSLFSYCVKILNYSEREASSRVNAARAMREFPELEEAISSGAMNLTSISQAQCFFNQEAKHREEPLTKTEKKEVLQKLEQKSTRETERILFTLSSAPEKKFTEKVKPISEKLTAIHLAFDAETMENLKRLQEIWSHAMPGGSFADVIQRSVKESRERHDPLLKAQRAHTRKQSHPEKYAGVEKHSTARSSKTEFTSARKSASPKADQQQAAAANSPRRGISSEVRHAVWLRDEGVCTYVDPLTGNICGSKHFLELDHEIPFGMGGENTSENLRLRCRAHNAWHAVQCYGAKKYFFHLESEGK